MTKVSSIIFGMFACYICTDMVHRDLKLENILLTTADFGPEFSIKVTDFGLSNMKGIAGCDEQMMDSRCGTLFYMGNDIYIYIYLNDESYS